MWKKLWFTPVSSAPVCLYRILYGLIALSLGLWWFPDALTWFGDQGVITLPTLRLWQPGARLDLITLLHPDKTGLITLFLIYLLASACLTVGLCTRLSSIVTWLLLVSFEHRNPLILTSGDKLMRIMGFLLIFAPAAKMFSIDSLLTKPRQSDTLSAPWAQRLIQLQVALVYWHAFRHKLTWPSWIDGTAVYYSILNSGHSRLPLPYLLDHLWTVKLLTWSVLAIELSLWSLIWIKACRYWVLVMGVLLHLGIDWTMYHHLFSCLMVASYLVFIEPADLQLMLRYGNALLQSITTLMMHKISAIVNRLECYQRK